MLRSSFGFVESLECSVHPLVEAPVTMHGDPVQITAVLDQVQRLDRPLQDTRERHVERQLVVVYHLQRTVHIQYSIINLRDNKVNSRRTGDHSRPVMNPKPVSFADIQNLKTRLRHIPGFTDTTDTRHFCQALISTTSTDTVRQQYQMFE